MKDYAMKMPLIALGSLLIAVALAGVASAQSKDTRCFELRTYHAAPGKLEDLHARFRNHTLKLFAKHGMTNLGYWVPLDEKDGAANTLIYLLYASLL